MNTRKKKETKKRVSFSASEPRFIERKESSSVTEFCIFPPPTSTESDITHQLSNAIYDIEIANQEGMKPTKQ